MALILKSGEINLAGRPLTPARFFDLACSDGSVCLCRWKSGPAPTFKPCLQLQGSRILLAFQSRFSRFLFACLALRQLSFRALFTQLSTRHLYSQLCLFTYSPLFSIVSCANPSGAGFSWFSVVVLSFLLALSSHFFSIRSLRKAQYLFIAVRLLRLL